MDTHKGRTEKLEQAVGSLQDEVQALGVGMNKCLQQLTETLNVLSNVLPPKTNPSLHDDDAETSRKNLLDHQFPRFTRGDPTEWFKRAAEFFDRQRTPEDQKVMYASSNMKGEAKQWWQWVKRTYKEENQTITWEKFAEELQAWFGARDHDEDTDEALLNIKQSGSLRDYLRDFERLGNRTHGWTQRKLVETFIRGLKGEIVDGVRMFEPKYLNEAISFAKMRDQQLQRRRHQTTTPSPNSTNTTYTCQPTDIIIYKAAIHDKWDSVSEIFDQYPELMTKTISRELETPLMIAVGTNNSHEFVQKLCERLSKGAVYAKNIEGNNALHYAAMVGNKTAARILLDQPRAYYDLMSVRNYNGNTPLTLAASVGEMNILMGFISMKTELRLHSILADSACDCGLASLIIHAGFPGLAPLLLDECPNILGEECCESLRKALEVLAIKVELFSCGRKFGFWGRLIYSWMPPVDLHGLGDEFRRKHGLEVKRPSIMNKLQQIIIRVWEILRKHDRTILSIHKIKENHTFSSMLVKLLLKTIIDKVDHDMAWKILGCTISTAVRHGNYELIEECILAYPSIIWYNFNGSYFFHSAIEQRQERVYNLINQISGHKTFLTSRLEDKQEDNVLHIAAKLAPPHRLNIITGAALQMQRELQWFKEVEKLVEPSYKEALNKNGKTPKMVFTDEHTCLLGEGQKWMKDTSSSATVVAALIVTMAFAAALTVPGGNKDDDGKPMFLNDGVFMLFIAADAIALFCSCTSVLMFLGSITSHYVEDDFLYVLPKRMTIGLVSLSLSIAATLVTFSATIILVLQDKVTWIAAPLVIMTAIPVYLFALLQFPLLKELVYSTFVGSIFCKQNKRMLH